MERTITGRAIERLARKAHLPLDPRRPIAIKRDVHEFEVSCDPDAFARAFKSVVTDPGSMFGIIRVKRPADRMGHEFEEGERFQGCFSIEHAVEGWARRGWRRLVGKVLGPLFRIRPTARVVGWIEDMMLSNYAEVESIVLEPDTSKGEIHRMQYRYLDGTPIAGSSIFEIVASPGGRCRIRQVFEYQEVNGIALGTFQRFGLKFHDQVVHHQIHKAAALAGAEVLSGTIPAAYA